MKLYCRIILLVIIAASSLFFIHNKTTKAEETKTLKVGAYENYPKIFHENDEYTGIFPEILSYIAEQENWTIEYEACIWSDCLDKLKNNELDIMVDVGFSDVRAEEYKFNEEPVFVNWGIVYSSTNQDIKSLPQLEGKRIGVLKDSIHYTGIGGIKETLEKYDIEGSYVEYDSYYEVFEALANKQVDAGVVNRLFGATQEKNYDIIQTPITINPVTVKFAFPKNSEQTDELISIIDKYLLDLKKDPSSIYYQTIDKYYVTETFEKKVTIPDWLLPSVLVGLSIVITSLILNFLLNKQLRKRNQQLVKLNSNLGKNYEEMKKTHEMIKEKEKELKKKIEELEKFNKVTINRELQMIELKKKLKNKRPNK